MLILSQKIWPKLVEGLLDGCHLFVDCQFFYKLEQLMVFFKNDGEIP